MSTPDTPLPDTGSTDTDTGERVGGADARPDLHLVREPDTAGTVIDGTAETTVEVAPEPVTDREGNPITPQAPLDVRLRESTLAFLRNVPAFGHVPASFRESIEYSQRGDWATSDTSAKRVAHGLATVLAFVGTYPLVEGLGKAREKPIGLVLAVLLLIATVTTVTTL